MAGRMAWRLRLLESPPYSRQQWRTRRMWGKPDNNDHYLYSLEDDPGPLPKQESKRKYDRGMARKYMRPFYLDIHFEKDHYIHAKIIHRGVHKVVASVVSSSRDLRPLFVRTCDMMACRIVGELLAARAKEVDCFTVSYTPHLRSKIDDRTATILDTMADSDISIFHEGKGLMLVR